MPDTAAERVARAIAAGGDRTFAMGAAACIGGWYYVICVHCSRWFLTDTSRWECYRHGSMCVQCGEERLMCPVAIERREQDMKRPWH